MYLTYIYTTNTYRMCKIRKRSLKKLSIFPLKYSRDYLDYSVDFSKHLHDGEHIVWGKVSVNSDRLVIENVYGHGPYVTGFISGGLSNHSYYLICQIKVLLIIKIIWPLVRKLMTEAQKKSVWWNGTAWTVA